MTRRLAMIWAEGFLDRVAAERVANVLSIDAQDTVCSDSGGVDQFWKSIPKYNEAAAQVGVVFALADHDSNGCVGPKIAMALPRRNPNLVLRLCVAELEAWLLADADGLAAHLSVSRTKIPAQPDSEPDPKLTIVNLSRTSSRGAIAKGMVPRVGHTSRQGPEYTLIMENFIRTSWDPIQGARRSPSLRRAIATLRAAASRRRG